MGGNILPNEPNGVVEKGLKILIDSKECSAVVSDTLKFLLEKHRDNNFRKEQEVPPEEIRLLFDEVWTSIRKWRGYIAIQEAKLLADQERAANPAAG